MNLFNMATNEICRWYKPKSENEGYLVEQLRETYADLEAMREMLSYHGLSCYCVNDLDRDLGAKTALIDNLKDEIERLNVPKI